MDDVAGALADIRAVMADAGYDDADYRLVLQGYPSPVPAGADFRYREGGWSRTTTGGCPFWDVDATWARDVFAPSLGDALADVAAAADAEFLDLSDAFDGREVCADDASQGTGVDAEWVRFVSTGILQGEIQESLHPNAYGQRALGACLARVHDAAPGSTAARTPRAPAPTG